MKSLSFLIDTDWVIDHFNGVTHVSRRSLSDDEQSALVLRINLAVRSNGQRGVRRAQRQIEENVLLQCAALRDRVQIAIFTVGVDYSLLIHHRSVDTPLEADVLPLIPGSIGNASNGAIGIAGAALIVGVLEFPLDIQIGVQLGDEERAIVAGRTECIHVAIGAKLRATAILDRKSTRL